MKTSRRKFGAGLVGLFGLSSYSKQPKSTRELSIMWNYYTYAPTDSVFDNVDRNIEKKRSITVEAERIPVSKKLSRNHISAILYSYSLDAPKKIAEYVQSKHDSMQTTIEELIHIAQSEIEYKRDYNTTRFPDYPRYANETLTTMYGDCIDKSVLLGSFLNALDIDHKYIFPLGHASLLIPKEFSEIANPDQVPDYPDMSYIETTSTSPIGQYPDEFKSRDRMLVFDPETKSVEHFDSDALEKSITEGADTYYTNKIKQHL